MPLLPHLAQGCLRIHVADCRVAVHTLPWFRVIVHEVCSECSVLGFSIPFKLRTDYLKCLNIAGIWLLTAHFGGGIRHVSFHCNGNQRTVNSLFHLSFKSPGVELGFRYSRIQELKQYCGISFSSFSSVLLPGDATRLPVTPGVKHWVDASSQSKKANGNRGIRSAIFRVRHPPLLSPAEGEGSRRTTAGRARAGGSPPTPHPCPGCALGPLYLHYGPFRGCSLDTVMLLTPRGAQA